jgi:hypothetical protein
MSLGRTVSMKGLYIAFTIDPEETFGRHGLVLDELARCQLRAFQRKTYVGYCSFVSATFATLNAVNPNINIRTGGRQLEIRRAS